MGCGAPKWTCIVTRDEEPIKLDSKLGEPALIENHILLRIPPGTLVSPTYSEHSDPESAVTPALQIEWPVPVQVYKIKGDWIAQKTSGTNY